MNLKSYLKKAKKEKWALGQFNFSNLEILKGIILAGKKERSPLVLGTSEREGKFLSLKLAIFLKEFFQKEMKLPIFLNLDHGKDLKFIKKAIELGYDCVHFDGSFLPFKKNLNFSRKIVEFAKRKGSLVEGEVGFIPEAGKKMKSSYLTDPLLAQEFVEKTKVDLLAISIGSFHGLGKAKLDFRRLEKIKEKVEKVFLVLHGGSGLEKGQIKEAISKGISKININTEIRKTFISSLKKSLKNEKEIRPYKILKEPIKEIERIVREKIKIFNSKNKL